MKNLWKVYSVSMGRKTYIKVNNFKQMWATVEMKRLAQDRVSLRGEKTRPRSNNANNGFN